MESDCLRGISSCWLRSKALCEFCKKTCSQEVFISSWQHEGVRRAGVKLSKECLSLDPALHLVRAPTSGASDLEPLLLADNGLYLTCQRGGVEACGSRNTFTGFRGCAAHGGGWFMGAWLGERL